jgi:hypothetical protein
MKPPVLPSGLQRGISFTIPDHWTPEQALAVFELLDDLREVVADRYLLQIQELLQEQRRSAHEGSSDASVADSDDSF